MTLRDRFPQATPTRDHERTHTMGASRDFTTGSDAAGYGGVFLAEAALFLAAAALALRAVAAPAPAKSA